MCWPTLFLLALMAAGTARDTSRQPTEISCVGESSIVGLSENLDFISLVDSKWAGSDISDHGHALWRSRDGVVVSWTFDGIMALEAAGKVTRWKLPEGNLCPSFAFLDGLAAVTSARIYRLQSDGRVQDVGPTPRSLSSGVRLQGPVLLPSGGGLVACFGTSVREFDDNRGHCVRHGPHGYDYAVDFGEPGAAFGEIAIATPPFTCGDAVISNRRGVVQSRRLSDGVRVATANIFAQRGSACLADERVLVVGKHEVRVLEPQRLRTRWRHPVKGTIRSAVACGGKVFLLLDKDPLPMAIALPQLSLGEARTPH